MQLPVLVSDQKLSLCRDPDSTVAVMRSSKIGHEAAETDL
jgi:hypothetical protein